MKKQAATGTPEFYYLFRSKSVTKTTPATKKGAKPTKTTTVTHSLLQGPTPTLKELLKPYGGHVPAQDQVMKVPQHRLVVSCPVAERLPGRFHRLDDRARTTTSSSTSRTIRTGRPSSPART